MLYVCTTPCFLNTYIVCMAIVYHPFCIFSSRFSLNWQPVPRGKDLFLFTQHNKAVPNSIVYRYVLLGNYSPILLHLYMYHKSLDAIVYVCSSILTTIEHDICMYTHSFSQTNYRPPSRLGTDIPLSPNVYNSDPSQPLLNSGYDISKVWLYLRAHHIMLTVLKLKLL